MFYSSALTDALRFGDLIQGFTVAASVIDDPIEYTRFSIDVHKPEFCVVLSPCCSIGNKVISLAPLEPLWPGLFVNPYLAEDPTRLNRKMPPDKAVPPRSWSAMGEDEKQKRLNEGDAYAFANIFVFDSNPILPEYEVHRKNAPNIHTRVHFVDFQHLTSVSCAKVNSASDSPIQRRLLQLSTETRRDLRRKLSAYFARVPVEDSIAAA